MADDPVRDVSVVPFLVVAAALIAGSAVLNLEYASFGLERIREGLWTSEGALGLYAGVTLGLAGLMVPLAWPCRFHVTEYGLLIVRGALVPRRHTVPVVTIRSVDVVKHRIQRDNIIRISFGVVVRRHAESEIEILRVDEQPEADALADDCTARWGLPPGARP